MPPCAQTECERLTGTIEKRSTGTPASAILMVVIRPARPPPTTIIRFSAIVLRPERHEDGERRRRHRRAAHQRDRPHRALRMHARREPPGDAERPDAVR